MPCHVITWAPFICDEVQSWQVVCCMYRPISSEGGLLQILYGLIFHGVHFVMYGIKARKTNQTQLTEMLGCDTRCCVLYLQKCRNIGGALRSNRVNPAQRSQGVGECCDLELVAEQQN